MVLYMSDEMDQAPMFVMGRPLILFQLEIRASCRIYVHRCIVILYRLKNEIRHVYVYPSVYFYQLHDISLPYVNGKRGQHHQSKKVKTFHVVPFFEWFPQLTTVENE